MLLADQTNLKLDNKQIFQISNSIQTNLSDTNNFPFIVDRLFICAKQGSEAVEALNTFGLYCPQTIVKSNSQGTLSKLFFFQNLYLAVVWLEDSCLEETAGINFAARVNWQETKASPFGIGLSRREEKEENLRLNKSIIDDLTVDRYIYYSQQNQRNLLEPFIFLLPDRLKYSNILQQDKKQHQNFISHPLGVKKVTNIQVKIEKGRRRTSSIINLLEGDRLLDFDRDNEPLLEITFDRARQGKYFDARPTLPVIFKY